MVARPERKGRHMIVVTLAISFSAALPASDRVEILDGKFPAPGPARCVRVHAAGAFEHATVRVNGTNAGELTDSKSEIDITGSLSSGAANTIEVRPRRGTVDRVWAWMSPLVYIDSAKFDRKAGFVEVTITNTTENTAQVDLGGEQQSVHRVARHVVDEAVPMGSRGCAEDPDARGKRRARSRVHRRSGY